jgi:flagellum-specific ATP synthase
MRNHFPAIDVLASISRLMTEIADAKHLKMAGDMRNLMSEYNENEEMIHIGAYRRGSNPRIDEAINKIDKINGFLKQGINESFTHQQTVKIMAEALK